VQKETVKRNICIKTTSENETN